MSFALPARATRAARRARLALVCGTLGLLLAHASAVGASLALTFDDGPDLSDTTGLTPAARNAALLHQLADAHLKTILFVTRTDADPVRNGLIREWGLAGHQIGNHTATHPNLEAVSLEAYERDLLACDAQIRDFPGYTRRFRFPYLKEGDTLEKRDGMRAFLDAQGYRPAPVSVDASDWYYSERLAARLRREPNADLRPYREAYLRHLEDRARYYDGLSRTVLGRSAAHVLLLHHNLINALFLRDVIRRFREKGWTWIDAETAFRDPLYSLRPDILPAGESILWALARQHGLPGLRSPGEDDVYEKPLLDRLHL